jgi:RNA polymerase sigma-70 factor (ECF subfamily)
MRQDDLYEEAVATYGRALERLVYAYEADPDKRSDLLQEIHIALWRSLKTFEDRCSLRTWVYCIAHNTATSHITRQRRGTLGHLVSLEELDSMPDRSGNAEQHEMRSNVDRLLKLIHRLNPVNRQLMLLYLEDMDAASIAEIMGISTNNVRVQIHRIKKVLARRFHAGVEQP